MARIDPSRQGDVDEPQDKSRVGRKNLNILNKSKKPQKLANSRSTAPAVVISKGMG